MLERFLPLGWGLARATPHRPEALLCRLKAAGNPLALRRAIRDAIRIPTVRSSGGKTAGTGAVAAEEAAP
jgi:hypothetical protein